MILKNGTFLEMINQIEGKNLILYGYGAQAKEICKRLEEAQANILVKAIIDNNMEKQGTTIIVRNKEVSIISKEKFLENHSMMQDLVILFTMDEFWGVYEDFEKIHTLNRISCYIYRLVCSEERGSSMYEADVPEEAFRDGEKAIIPKKIHYCWFGNGELSPRISKCIDSWKKYCPDFEIIRWDESNYDVTKNKYMHQAYKEKKWAYVSDYARIDIVNEYGGVYLDTDVELIRSIDRLLTQKAFAGFQQEELVAFGLGYGSVANNPILKDILQLYDSLEWDGGKVPCPVYQTKVLQKHGLIPQNSFQKLADMTILPVRCLCGKSIITRREWRFRDTFSIHHFEASWVELTEERIRLKKYYALGEKAEYEVICEE